MSDSGGLQILQLEDLYGEYIDEEGNALCERCPRLVESRNLPVWGEGAGQCDLLIVGEAPGYYEDEIGRPFVGRPGVFLDGVLAWFAPKENKWLRKMGNDITAQRELRSDQYDALRDELIEQERVFYTNGVMCRPPENVDPTSEEMLNCRDRLLTQIYRLDPLMILALGRVAARAVLKKTIRITSDRGMVFDLSVPGSVGSVRYPVFVTYHPAFVLRSQDFISPTGPGQMFAKDIGRVYELLDRTRELERRLPRPTRRKW